MAKDIPEEECAEPPVIASVQGQRLHELLGRLHGSNHFYTRKLDEAGIRVATLELPRDLLKLPLTTKGELVADQAAHPPWGTATTEPIHHYTRYCQT